MSEDEVLVNFGDVFVYNDTEFVYLAESPEKQIIYAARILSETDSQKLIALHEKAQYKAGFAHNSMVFSFVVLDTQAFKDQLAWFRDTGKEGPKVTKAFKSLDDEDLDKIQKEILNGPFPEDLKDKIKKTTE